MSKIVKDSENLILAGDFNIDLLKVLEREKYAEFLDIMLSFGLQPRITYPTRYAKKSASLIDHIYVSQKLSHIIDHTSKSGILHTAISDHLGTFTTFHYKSIKSNPKYVVIQKQDQVALEAFKNAISPESILSRINSSNWGDPNHTFEVISTEIKIAKDKFLPSKRVRFNKYKHKNKNWITLGILKSIHTRDKLYTKYKSCKHTNDNYNLNKTRYNNFNRILKKAINEAKNKYYSNEFSKYSDNLKKS